MKTRRGVAVIGLGNWGSSLAAALEATGLLVERVHAQRRGTRAKLDAQVLWVCVPDAAIADTAEWIVAQRGDLSGQVLVHSSGALDQSVLAVAKRAGARTGSVHPMMSFPTRRVVALKGTHFGIEAGDAATRKQLFALSRRLGGRPFAIESGGKAMYHAGAMFGSPCWWQLWPLVYERCARPASNKGRHWHCWDQWRLRRWQTYKGRD
jgi:predicted short-subunit dehydrogenase-like oxidoreductase (DUF2520 family)